MNTNEQAPKEGAEEKTMMLTNGYIEKYGYRDNGEYQSTDQIEPWIEGAKWARDFYEIAKQRDYVKLDNGDADILFGLAIAEYCTESEKEGFTYDVSKGCSLEKSNGFNAGFLNGFQKGYLHQQQRIADLETQLKRNREALREIINIPLYNDYDDRCLSAADAAISECQEIAEQALKEN